MPNELEGLAKNLADSVNGKGGKGLEKIMKALSTESGKRILMSILSDGGEKVRKAATGAKNGDMRGVQAIISSVAETEEGRELLSDLLKNDEK